MFKKYMDLAKINKIIAKQRKLAATNDSGYTAIISAMLEHEAKGTFKTYPEYTRKVVNDFFAENVYKLKNTQFWADICASDGKKPEDSKNGTVVLFAVISQAVYCKDFTLDDAKAYLTDIDNGIKVLVNMKLLPERCLNDCEFDMRVA